MATEQFEAVVERLSADKSFRMQYCQNPDRALEDYLSPEEIAAVKTGDGQRLRELGHGDQVGELTEALCGHDPGP